RLAGGLDVHATEPLLFHAPFHEGLHTLVSYVGLASLPGAAQQKRELVDARVGDAELHIGSSRLPHQRDGIAAPRRFDQPPQAIAELLEALLDQAVEERL